MMSRQVAERCVQLMEAPASSLSTVDITGGAPELMPQFRWVPLCGWQLGFCCGASGFGRGVPTRLAGDWGLVGWAWTHARLTYSLLPHSC